MFSVINVLKLYFEQNEIRRGSSRDWRVRAVPETGVLPGVPPCRDLRLPDPPPRLHTRDAGPQVLLQLVLIRTRARARTYTVSIDR